MLNADFGSYLFSFVVKLIGTVPTFRIFVLRMEYLLQKLEVRVGNYSLLVRCRFHPR